MARRQRVILKRPQQKIIYKLKYVSLVCICWAKIFPKIRQPPSDYSAKLRTKEVSLPK